MNNSIRRSIKVKFKIPILCQWGMLILCCLSLVACKSMAYQEGTEKNIDEDSLINTNELNPLEDTLSSSKSSSIYRLPELQDEIDCRDFLTPQMYYDGMNGDYSMSIPDYKFLEADQLEEVNACILPHHNVAYQMISDFYSKTSESNDYELVLVLSPNHKSVGTRFQVTSRDFYCYDGILSTDKQVVKQLLESPLVTEAYDEIIEEEHGQLVHMPFIQRYYPEVEVVSLIIGETRELDGIEPMALLLQQVLKDKRVLIVGSIDFSHYLKLEEAEIMDQFTREIIESGSDDKMVNLSNDYIDSPSTYLLLKTYLNLEEAKDTKVTITNHSNSALILRDMTLDETTSYFQVIYSE